MRHTEKWYQRRLAKYFTEHYSKYELVADFCVDPAPNVWQFIIPEQGLKITFVCDDLGEICERIEHV